MTSRRSPVRSLVFFITATVVGSCGGDLADPAPVAPARPPTGSAPPPAGTPPAPGAAEPPSVPPVTAPPASSPPSSPPATGTTPAIVPVPPADPSLPVFDESRIIDLHLSFAPGNWEKLLNPPGADDARYVPCVFRFETETINDAACRRKGNDDYWQEEMKPQFIVRFNLYNKKGRFRGLRRLNLEAFHDTPAPVRDRLGMWIMRQAGVDASRVNHARVFKDGQLLGLYMNIEAVDHEFLEDHFPKESDGNLFESAVDLKTNEVVADRSRLLQLELLINDEPLEGDHTAFYAKLDALMDVDQVLREMAAETAALADDNFSNGGANYYLYDHPRRGFMVLPWDFDTMFVSTADADPFAFWDGADPNKLRQLMYQNPAWRESYVSMLAEIRDKALPGVPALVDAICAQVAPAVREDLNRHFSYEEFLKDCQVLKARGPERIVALKRMLGR